MRPRLIALVRWRMRKPVRADAADERLACATLGYGPGTPRGIDASPVRPPITPGLARSPELVPAPEPLSADHPDGARALALAHLISAGNELAWIVGQTPSDPRVEAALECWEHALRAMNWGLA